MNRNPFPRTMAALMAIALLFGGCAHVVQNDQGVTAILTSEAFSRFSGEYENTAYFKRHKPKTIAVMPFADDVDQRYGIENGPEGSAGIVRRGMVNHLASLPFVDQEIRETDRRLKNAGITDVRAIDTLIARNPGKLKSLLGVDAVVTGRVTHFDRIFIGIYSQIAVGCEVKLWDLKTGNLLWRAKQVERAHAGGISTTPIGLVLSAVASVWNLRQDEFLTQTDNLFREIVSTIALPKSERFAISEAPRIDLFTVTGAGKPYTLGKAVTFRMVGAPHCNAYADLGDFKSGIALAPVSSTRRQQLKTEILDTLRKQSVEAGKPLTPETVAAVTAELGRHEIYEGRYVVNPNEQAYGLIAKGYLVDDAGNQGQALDAVHVVDIDSLPPAAATGLATEALDTKVRLTWSANHEPDLAGYEIWTSPSALSGFSLAARTEATDAVLGHRKNFDRFYVRVRAVDKAGNPGPFGSSAAAVAAPVAGLNDLPTPGPTLGGVIRGGALLTPERSPYVVVADLRVEAGGKLYIEPGVRVLFSPNTALVVHGGRLFAFGEAQRPVEFRPNTASAERGGWRGIEITGAEACALTGVVIDRAVVGLTVADSAPSVIGARIVKSAQAGIYLKDNARPEISCSTVADSQGQGALVMAGAGLNPIIRNNRFENNDPFQVQSYAPTAIDLSGNYWGRPDPKPEWFLGDVTWAPPLSAAPAPCGAD
jgi:hypothetical protein